MSRVPGESEQELLNTSPGCPHTPDTQISNRALQPALHTRSCSRTGAFENSTTTHQATEPVTQSLAPPQSHGDQAGQHAFQTVCNPVSLALIPTAWVWPVATCRVGCRAAHPPSGLPLPHSARPGAFLKHVADHVTPPIKILFPLAIREMGPLTKDGGCAHTGSFRGSNLTTCCQSCQLHCGHEAGGQESKRGGRAHSGAL